MVPAHVGCLTEHKGKSTMNDHDLLKVAASMAAKDGYAAYRERAAELLRQMEDAGLTFGAPADDAPKRPVADRRGRPRYNADTISEIGRLWLAGYSIPDIAKKTGASMSTVSYQGRKVRRRALGADSKPIWADTGEPVVRPSEPAE